jgi:hypothetical protein
LDEEDDKAAMDGDGSACLSSFPSTLLEEQYPTDKDIFQFQHSYLWKILNSLSGWVFADLIWISQKTLVEQIRVGVLAALCTT